MLDEMKCKENLKGAKEKDILPSKEQQYVSRATSTEGGFPNGSQRSRSLLRGNLDGPGPHPGKENAGAEKGPGPGSRSGQQKASRSPRRQRSTSPCPSQLKERRAEEKKQSKERQITEEYRGHSRERSRNGDVNGICLHEREKGGWLCKGLCHKWISEEKRYAVHKSKRWIQQTFGLPCELKC